MRWSKHSQVVEKIRSYPNIVKLTLVNAKPRPREAALICDENQPSVRISTASQRMLDSTTHSNNKSPKLGKSSIKLFNFGKKSYTPANDIPVRKVAAQVPILFNKEDDEIYHDRENVNFWQHLKTVRMPSFTNTITLGRKFKRNVLKMSIFNTFSISNENPTPTEDFADTGNKLDKLEKKSFILKDLWSNEIKQMNETCKKTYSRNKILRANKQKKLFQKALDTMSKNLNNNMNINDNNLKSGRLLSYQSNLYKTL